MGETTWYLLAEDRKLEIWYDLATDRPPPVLHPGIGHAIGPDDLAPLFPMALIAQEVSAERHIPIPRAVA